ncbi:RidA family protein [Herbaspirillum sp.]|uniref:RidA family protein n=1 Tax=Herbaspirillum sp. TaxID=1890675 RepID=UPI0031D71029
MSQYSSLPFSKLRIVNGLAFLSGEVPLTSEGTIPEGISAQTQLVIERIAHTLGEAGLKLTNVVSATVYLTDKNDFSEFNEVYRNFFSAPYPARTTLVADLVLPAKIEIAVVASVE